MLRQELSLNLTNVVPLFSQNGVERLVNIFRQVVQQHSGHYFQFRKILSSCPAHLVARTSSTCLSAKKEHTTYFICDVTDPNVATYDLPHSINHNAGKDAQKNAGKTFPFVNSPFCFGFFPADDVQYSAGGEEARFREAANAYVPGQESRFLETNDDRTSGQ